jgi:hypothetical protein
MHTAVISADATKQMNAYGELPSGALDHVASKLTGHVEDKNLLSTVSRNAIVTGDHVRRWDDSLHRYVFAIAESDVGR